MTPCCKCGAATDVMLCGTCAVALRIELTDVPSLLDDLDVTRSRQDQLTSPYGNGPSGDESPLPFKTHIAETAWVLHHTLNAWATTLSGSADHANKPPTTAQLARWLVRNIAAARMHPDAGQLVDEVTSAIHQARRAIDRPDDRRCFLGQCATGVCVEEVYGLPWNRYAICPACGARHDIAARQAWMNDVARDHLGTAVEISGFLRIVGVRCTSSMIRGYAIRGRLTPAPDQHPPLYRIRDVLTALEDRYRHRKAS
jgi:hypothetical protein